MFASNADVMYDAQNFGQGENHYGKQGDIGRQAGQGPGSSLYTGRDNGYKFQSGYGRKLKG